MCVVELKGQHLKPKYESKDTSRPQIGTKKSIHMLSPELKRVLSGRGALRRCSEYSDQLALINGCKAYHFTLTEGTGQRRYLTSIIFYELAMDTANHKAYLIPMVYTLISSYPVFKFQKQYLRALFTD